eukprot:m.328595 g.328595  ORF g.328595 m.328595 type:complete len:441 (-) comp20434_c0_seq3:431-1753(-)
MAWGKSPATSAVDDWCAKLKSGDAKFKELHVLPFRPFPEADAIKLCKALETNTTLTSLKLSGKKLTPLALEAMAHMFAVNQGLRTVAVGDKSLGADGLASLVTAGLEKNSSIESIDLSFKGLSDTCGNTLRQLSSAPTALQTLILSRNELGDEAVTLLLEGNTRKRSNPGNVITLQSLDLGQTNLSATIIPLLQDSLTHLSTLILSANPLGVAGGAELGRLLLSSTSEIPCTLKVLELIDCRLGEGANAIIRAVPACVKLQKLYLAANEIPAATCETIKAMISTKTSLEVLSLRANANIKDNGATIIACAMQESAASGTGTQLTSLDVGQCGITLEGAVALLQTPSLEELLLNCNTVGSGRLARASVAAAVNMQHLDLSATQLSQGDTLDFLEALREDKSLLPQLRAFSVGGNDIKDIDAMQEKVQQMKEARPELSITWR